MGLILGFGGGDTEKPAALGGKVGIEKLLETFVLWSEQVVVLRFQSGVARGAEGVSDLFLVAFPEFFVLGIGICAVEKDVPLCPEGENRAPKHRNELLHPFCWDWHRACGGERNGPNFDKTSTEEVFPTNMILLFNCLFEAASDVRWKAWRKCAVDWNCKRLLGFVRAQPQGDPGAERVCQRRGGLGLDEECI